MLALFWVLLGAVVGGMASATIDTLRARRMHAHDWTNWRRNSALSDSIRWQYRECKTCGFTDARDL